MPFTREPMAYFVSTWLQGSDCFCFSPRETLPSLRSRFKIITSILSPTATTSEGWAIFDQLISVICNRPSTPPKSIKAPKSVMPFTTPDITSPIFNAVQSFSRPSSLSLYTASLRETIMLWRIWLSLTNLNLKGLFIISASDIFLKLDKERGRNPSMPATSTRYPPLIFLLIEPSTRSPSRKLRPILFQP